MENCPQIYKVKQSKNGKVTSNYKASPIDLETQISLRRLAPPKISPPKRAFEKYKTRGLFSEQWFVKAGHYAAKGKKPLQATMIKTL